LENSEESLENFTSEKEIKMSSPRILNLNTRPFKTTKRRRRIKAHSVFHFRTNGIKIIGKEDDKRECIECHVIFPITAFTTKNVRTDGAYYLQARCRHCSVRLNLEKNEVRKNAPPKPNHCACCHKNKKLELDHLHGTTTFRGWVCGQCNKGIGAMGDTLEGVLRSVIYLGKDKSKIIETLNGIKNEK